MTKTLAVKIIQQKFQIMTNKVLASLRGRELLRIVVVLVVVPSVVFGGAAGGGRESKNTAILMYQKC